MKKSKGRRSNPRAPKPIPPMKNERNAMSSGGGTKSVVCDNTVDPRLVEHFEIMSTFVQWMHNETDAIKRDLKKSLDKGTILPAEKIEALLLQRMENECLKRRELLRKKMESARGIESPVPPRPVAAPLIAQPFRPIPPFMPYNRHPNWAPRNANVPPMPMPLPPFIPPIGSPYGPTVVLNEVINADFLVHRKLREQPVIYGYMSLNFPMDTAKIVINSGAADDFIFRLRNTKNVKKLHPQNPQINIRNHPSGGTFLEKDEAFIIRRHNMVSALQKLRRNSPDASFLRLSVLKYDIGSLRGISTCPLSLDVNWVLEDPIRVTVGYKCNPDVVSTNMVNVIISVKMDQSFEDYNAKPMAERPKNRNQIDWKFDYLKPGNFGKLSAYFESDSEDLDPGLVTASFDCLTANISGLDIEMPQFSRFPVKAVNKRFKSGEYICDDYSDM